MGKTDKFFSKFIPGSSGGGSSRSGGQGSSRGHGRRHRHRERGEPSGSGGGSSNAIPTAYGQTCPAEPTQAGYPQEIAASNTWPQTQPSNGQQLTPAPKSAADDVNEMTQTYLFYWKAGAEYETQKSDYWNLMRANAKELESTHPDLSRYLRSAMCCTQAFRQIKSGQITDQASLAAEYADLTEEHFRMVRRKAEEWARIKASAAPRELYIHDSKWSNEFSEQLKSIKAPRA